MIWAKFIRINTQKLSFQNETIYLDPLSYLIRHAFSAIGTHINYIYLLQLILGNFIIYIIKWCTLFLSTTFYQNNFHLKSFVFVSLQRCMRIKLIGVEIDFSDPIFILIMCKCCVKFQSRNQCIISVIIAQMS